MKTKDDHPNGEDFLITKIAQLRWLYEDIPESKGSWDILIVDDGCPDGATWNPSSNIPPPPRGGMHGVAPLHQTD